MCGTASEVSRMHASLSQPSYTLSGTAQTVGASAPHAVREVQMQQLAQLLSRPDDVACSHECLTSTSSTALSSSCSRSRLLRERVEGLDLIRPRRCMLASVGVTPSDTASPGWNAWPARMQG